MTSPLISCIVPVYNGERYLGETLDSILAQTHRPIEVIVVDDGSTDGTAAVVAGYADRVRYIRQPRAGPLVAYNRGVASARGAYLAFLDADDLWHPDKLARQMARFQERPDLALCITHVQNFWIDALAVEAARFRGHRRGQPVPGYTVVTLLARAEVFDRIGQFDAALRRRFQADWFARARDHGVTLELIPDVLAYRRLHASNMSRGDHGSIRDDYLTVVKRSLDRRRAGRLVNDGRNVAAPGRPGPAPPTG